MKELLEKLAWKKCHIATVNHKFKDATILDVADGFPPAGCRRSSA